MKPRICLVTPEFPPRSFGGLARTAERVAHHLAAAGFGVQVAHPVITEEEPPLLDENDRVERQGDVQVHELTVGRERYPVGGRTLWDCPHTLTLQMFFESLERLERRERFDLWLSFFLYPMGYLTGLAARQAGAPHLACVVGNDVRKYLFSPEKAALCKSGLDNADRVVFLSQTLENLAHALTPVKHKSRIIHNSVAPSDVAWKGPPPPGTFRIGCAGIFKHAKGIPYLLKAMAGLRRTGAATLELAGQTRTEEAPVIASLMTRLDVREAVRQTGVIKHPDMAAWLAQLDAFALPSLSEGCPNVLMEAMAVGLPCVATRVGAVEDLIEHGISGLSVPSGDAAALAGALAQIREDPALALRLGRAARDRMRTFSPERERKEWTQVIGELLPAR